jgi:hypothetical protein
MLSREIASSAPKYPNTGVPSRPKPNISLLGKHPQPHSDVTSSSSEPPAHFLCSYAVYLASLHLSAPVPSSKSSDNRKRQRD